MERIALGFFKKFQDNIGFKQNRFPVYQEQGDLAERLQLDEPIRLGGEIDGAPTERNLFYPKCNRYPLCVGAECMTDKCRGLHGWFSRVRSIINAIACI